MSGMEQLQRLFAARRFAELETKFHQRRAQVHADGRFIIDNQNANSRLVHHDSLFRAGDGMAA